MEAGFLLRAESWKIDSAGRISRVNQRKTTQEQFHEVKEYLGHGLHEFREWSARQFAPTDSSVEWRSLARAFFKLGATGFGGGLAVIAQIRRLVVHDRRWLSEE